MRHVPFILCLAVLVGAAVVSAAAGQPANIAPGRIESLTVEQAEQIVTKESPARGIYLNKITELPAAAAAVLARHAGPLISLPALERLSPEAAAALAPHNGDLQFPKLTELPVDVARGLASHKGQLALPSVTNLTTEAAVALAPHTGMLELGSVELPADVARALAEHAGPIHLPALTSLSSLPLARKFGRQGQDKPDGFLFVRLESLKSLSKEMAEALGPPMAKKNHWLVIGIETLPEDVADALARTWHIVAFARLSNLTAEAATALGKYRMGQIILPEVKAMPVEVAAALAKVNTHILALNGLEEVPPEVERAMATRSAPWQLWSLKKIATPEFAAALLQRDSPHQELDTVTMLSDEAAAVFAKSDTKNRHSFSGLTSLTSVPLAEKLASVENLRGLRFPKLMIVSDNVARALARQKGKLDLSGLTSLSTGAAAALAGHEGELGIGGIKELSADAAAALAKATGSIALGNLSTVSPAGLAALRANPKISLPATLK